jgi:hypothetical protein
MPSKKKPTHLRGGGSARAWGREPKVHYARDSYEGDEASLCERSGHGTPTTDPVDCRFCLRIASGGH